MLRRRCFQNSDAFAENLWAAFHQRYDRARGVGLAFGMLFEYLHTRKPAQSFAQARLATMEVVRRAIELRRRPGVDPQ
jgi:hypothetical protein